MSIPKKIHYCWVGGGEMPESNQRCLASWQKFCPDYEIVRWDESNYDFGANRYTAEAYCEKKWGFVPDFPRLDIIYRHGGIYLDTDVELLRPLDDLLDDACFFGFDKANHIALGLGFGAEAGNAVIGRLRDMFDDISFYKPDGTLDTTPAPVRTNTFLAQSGLLRLDGTLQRANGIAAYPYQWFDPYNGIENRMDITPDTHSIHWYDASWMDEKQREYVEKMTWYHRRFGKRLGDIVFWPSSMVHTYGVRGAVRRIWNVLRGRG